MSSRLVSVAVLVSRKMTHCFITQNDDVMSPQHTAAAAGTAISNVVAFTTTEFFKMQFNLPFFSNCLTFPEFCFFAF